MKIAIVAVAYNRVDSLSRLLDSLDKANYDVESPTLIISIDKSKTDVVENFADKYEWKHGDKIVDKHEKNLGLRLHMMSLGKWLERFDAIVILEDDIVVSPSFFSYSRQTVEKYHSDPNVAGVSLYSFRVNYQRYLPFEALKDEHDVFFMNCAMSWGEVWMRNSWKMFYDWYGKHHDFKATPNLPKCLYGWNDKSWLKYHTRYCIEENKFFVYPYTSLSTNFEDAGEHSEGANTVFQVPVQYGNKTDYILPEFGSNAVCYDGFFENVSLYKVLGYDSKMLCIDLYSESNNRQKKRYWLSTRIKDYKIIKSYGLNYRPIELNVIMNNPGIQIFLYDTSVIEKNPNKGNGKNILYHYHLTNMSYFIKRYGLGNLLKDLILAIKSKVKLNKLK